MVDEAHLKLWKLLCAGGGAALLGTFPQKGILTIEDLNRHRSSHVLPPAEPEQLKGIAWNRIMFKRADLSNLRLLDAEIMDCEFVECDWAELRAWSTRFSHVTFNGSLMSGCSIAGVHDGRRNVLEHCRFVNCDMSRTNFASTRFVDCTFEKSKLNKASFGASQLIRCRFAGVLRDTYFSSMPNEGEGKDMGQLESVDFSQSKMRWVDIRGYDLTSVQLPSDSDHLRVSSHYGRVLDQLLVCFAPRTDAGAKALVAYLTHQKRWAGANQQQGVFNRKDIVEMGGKEGLVEFERVLAAARG